MLKKMVTDRGDMIGFVIGALVGWFVGGYIGNAIVEGTGGIVGFMVGGVVGAILGASLGGIFIGKRAIALCQKDPPGYMPRHVGRRNLQGPVLMSQADTSNTEAERMSR